ncbi:NADH-ubiquinone oxidoreductase chain 6 [Manis javanica]|nr:NADH-ubiquinone oxidoreductase chain 6 [Manis javanica]
MTCIYCKYYICDQFYGFFFKTFSCLWSAWFNVAGEIGCGIVVNFGGSFLGLIVFFIYLGGMLIVWGIRQLWLLRSILRFEYQMLYLVLSLLV